MPLQRFFILMLLLSYSALADAQATNESNCTRDELVASYLKDRANTMQIKQDLDREVKLQLAARASEINVLSGIAFCGNKQKYQDLLLKLLSEIGRSYSGSDNAHMTLSVMGELNEIIPIQATGIARGLSIASMSPESKNASCRAVTELADKALSEQGIEP
jgi:hypothetical protein